MLNLSQVGGQDASLDFTIQVDGWRWRREEELAVLLLNEMRSVVPEKVCDVPQSALCHLSRVTPRARGKRWRNMSSVSYVQVTACTTKLLRLHLR